MSNYWKKYKDQIKNKFGDRFGIVRCFYCGEELIDSEEIKYLSNAMSENGLEIDRRCKNNASADHVTPISKGGVEDFDNIVPCCLPCNKQKSASTQGEKWKPKVYSDHIRNSFMEQLQYIIHKIVNKDETVHPGFEWYEEL